MMDISKYTYEEFLLRYIDNELSDTEKKQVEAFVRDHPEYEAEFRLLQQTICIPDTSVRFAGKASLYRREKKRVWLLSGRIAAAASLVLLVGIAAWLFLDDRETDSVTRRVTGSGLPTEERFPAEERLAMEKKLPAKENPSDSDNSKREGILAGSPSEKESPGKVPVVEKPRVENTIDQRSTNTAGKHNLQRKPGRHESLPSGADDADSEQKQLPERLPATQIPEYAALDPQPIDPPLAIQTAPPVIWATDPPVQGQLTTAVNSAVEDESQSASFAVFANEDRGDEVIYFANTAIPKQNRLRGIFRTATRIIDKVTSSQ